MIACKICEKEVLDDLLAEHSQKCREVNEYKETLREIVLKMEGHGDKALIMKNSLETFATKQQKKYNKKASSRDLSDLSLQGRSKSFRGSQGTSSPMKGQRGNESDQVHSESGEKTERTLSTQETVETQDDWSRKLGKDDVTGVLEEVKKSMIVLKKVIVYAKNIADWALELCPVCEVGKHTQLEIENDEKEINDESVLTFLRTFIGDLKDYIKLKEKYVEATQQLAKIGGEKNCMITKQKFAMKKSVSFKTKPGELGKNPLSIFKNNSKPEENNTFTPAPVLPKKKDSPSMEKKKFSVTAVPSEVGSPVSSKASLRQLPKGTEGGKPNILSLFASPSSQNLRQLLQPNSNHITAMSTFATPRRNPDDSNDQIRPLLQMNLNHIIGASNFATPRRNPEEASAVREKLKAINSTFFDKSPANSERGGGFMSPVFLSSPKRDAQAKKATRRFNMMNNTPLSTFAKTKNEGKQPIEEIKAPVEQKRSQSKERSPKVGPAGMDWFKNLRNEDTSTLNKFASIPLNKLSINVSNNSIHDDNSPKSRNGGTTTTNANSAFKPKNKKEELKEFFESPLMKGYYSDCNASRSKRRISRIDSNDVTLEDFEFIKFLGKGAYGTVWLVKKKATGAHYAMKMVDWADRGTQNRMKALKAEKDIYQRLEGDFVVKALWTFHYENLICFVTEYMVGGDFNKILDKLVRLDEDQAKFYFAELILAIESLHNLKIIHRDLKPDNILMDEKGHIRLTDFGLSQKGITSKLKGSGTPSRKNSTSPNSQEEALAIAKLNKLSKMCKNSPNSQSKGKVEFRQRSATGAANPKTTQKIFSFLGKDEEYQKVMEKKPIFNRKGNNKDSSQGDKAGDKKPKMVGTPDYMAPEIISPDKYDLEGYDEKCMDWWSMGIILYQFLVGLPPFNDSTVDAVFENIRNYNIEWPEIGDGEDCISHNAYDLITKLLNPDPKKRLGAKGIQEVKNHPFFKGINWETLRESEAPILPCSLEEEESVSSPSKKDSPPMSSPLEGFGIRRTKTARPMDFGAFQMRRLDLLDKANQQTHRDLVRQKSGKLKL